MKLFDIKTLSNFRFASFLALAFFVVLGLGACKDDDDIIDPDTDTDPDPVEEALDAQVRVQVAYDATEVAFRFVWKSKQKTLPAGQANNGMVYPGHFHDVLKHDGTSFNRLASDARMQEDRVSFFIDSYEGDVPGFETASCAMICHAGMERHNLSTAAVIDHWHWRGGRSGPMGYAEDVAVNDVERIRDDAGTPPSNFIRSGGDRLREDQGAMSGTEHAVLSDGFPRFVFNKGKIMPDGYDIPAYFIVKADNTVATNPYTDFPAIKNLDHNLSLLVIYQDHSFDNVDKVNSIDLAYLVYVAYGTVAHLPEHLQDTGSEDFTKWTNYWDAELDVDAAAAETILDEVHAEWVSSGNNAMVARSVGFIFESDMHDISADRNFDATAGEWEVIMYRKLSSASPFDANLAGLPTGEKFALGFATHDLGGAGASHDFSMTYVLSNDSETGDIVAKQVSNVKQTNWSEVPKLDTYYVKTELHEKWTEEWLKGHAGGTGKCSNCHTDDNRRLTYETVQF